MIRLKDVSTIDFIVKNNSKSGDFHKEISELLEKYEITDYQRLEDFINSNSARVISWDAIDFLRSELKQVKYYVDYANAQFSRPNIFSFPSHDGLVKNSADLHYTDKKNNGDVLLLNNPFETKRKHDELDNYTISQIKHMLGHVDPRNFDNCLLRVSGISLSDIYRTITALNYYSDQVLRQALTTRETDANLFTLNKDKKVSALQDEIDNDIMYLLENGNEFIWGDLSDRQKEHIFKSLIKGDKMAKEYRQRLIDILSNYTTMSEIDKGLTNEQEVPVITDSAFKLELVKPIDRVIVR